MIVIGSAAAAGHLGAGGGSSGGGSEGDGEQNAPPCLSRCVVVMRGRRLQQRAAIVSVSVYGGVSVCVCGDCNGPQSGDWARARAGCIESSSRGDGEDAGAIPSGSAPGTAPGAAQKVAEITNQARPEIAAPAQTGMSGTRAPLRCVAL